MGQTQLTTFQPVYGEGIVVVTGASTSAAIKKGTKSICITNQDATDGIFIRLSVGASTATNADYYLPPSGQSTLTKSPDQDTITHLAAANTPSLHYIVGNGQ